MQAKLRGKCTSSSACLVSCCSPREQGPFVSLGNGPQQHQSFSLVGSGYCSEANIAAFLSDRPKKNKNKQQPQTNNNNKKQTKTLGPREASTVLWPADMMPAVVFPRPITAQPLLAANVLVPWVRSLPRSGHLAALPRYEHPVRCLLGSPLPPTPPTSLLSETPVWLRDSSPWPLGCSRNDLLCSS